jgi:hypothetical protein
VIIHRSNGPIIPQKTPKYFDLGVFYYKSFITSYADYSKDSGNRLGA